VDLEVIGSGEGLVTICPGALVWLGACVRASMSREGTGRGECRAATFPGALPSLGGGFVSHAMDLESARVGECCGASRPCALVFFGAGVQKLMILEARVGLEGGTAAGVVALELLARFLHLIHIRTAGCLGRWLEVGSGVERATSAHDAVLLLAMADQILERVVLKATLGQIALEAAIGVAVVLLMCDEFDFVGFFATTELARIDGTQDLLDGLLVLVRQQVDERR